MLPKTVLVGFLSPREKMEQVHHHLDELAQLADTAGLTVAKRFVQKTPKGAIGSIGKGKASEIADYISLHQIKLVILDKELTPSQLKQLEKYWKCTIWDRSVLIMTIFKLNASTSQAKTQVDLAWHERQLRYLTGRWSHHSRQQGGVGTRGPGEKELETDRRIVRQKIKILKKKLDHIAQISRTKRKHRQHKTRVALVGYTNAGKSTVMRYLANEEVYIADKLFATLGSTVRKIMLDKTPILLSDTVGFIRKLPHELIACFRSTLAEVREASLLLHVVDFSNPCYEEHIQVVFQTLHEIGAGHIPMVIVLNKTDQVTAKEEDLPPGFENPKQVVFLEAERERISLKYQRPTIFCSILHQENTNLLKQIISREVKKIRKNPKKSPYKKAL
ncbi:MAG: GTPase HflX [Cytophagales bacterium]